MKALFILILLSTFFVACKTKQPIVNTTTEATNTAKTKGVVSHKYKTTGCGSVVIITYNDKEVVLIPRDGIDKKFDIDGKTIFFNFRKLRMPNPAGCTEGTPAELKDVE